MHFERQNTIYYYSTDSLHVNREKGLTDKRQRAANSTILGGHISLTLGLTLSTAGSIAVCKRVGKGINRTAAEAGEIAHDMPVGLVGIISCRTP